MFEHLLERPRRLTDVKSRIQRFIERDCMNPAPDSVSHTNRFQNSIRVDEGIS